MEKEALKSVALNEEAASEAPSKRKRIDDTKQYWSQFTTNKENADFFSTIVKKKSRLEQEKEQAIKAKIEEQEAIAKNRDSLNARKQIVLKFNL